MSELVTNAVLHADSQIELRVARQNHLIRFEVEDHGQGKPMRRTAAPEETSGRGLALVDTLSSAWGVDPVHLARPSGSSSRPDSAARPPTVGRP